MDFVQRWIEDSPYARTLNVSLADIDGKIAALRTMRDTLDELIERCHGDSRPDCPILADLAGKDGVAEIYDEKSD